MKKIATLLLAAGFALSLSAQGQDTTKTALSATDSLAQRVQQLEQQVSSIQEDQKMAEIWKRKKYIQLSIGSQSLKDEDAGIKYKSKTAIGLQWDWWHVRFHKKPIAKMVMIGLDIALDVHYAKYKDTEAIEEEISDEDESDYSDILDDIDMMQVDAGLAIGPIVEVAPFSYTNNAAKDLKAFAYYHLTPSYSGIILDGDVNGAFNMFHGIGFGLTWKWLSLGYEYRFGTAKYDNFSLDDVDEDDFSSVSDLKSDEKPKFKTATNHFFLRINF